MLCDGLLNEQSSHGHRTACVGLRLRVGLSDRMWLAPVLMAMLAMVLTIAAIVGVGIALGLTLGAALLLASILAPTDPVLASDVQVDNIENRDQLQPMLPPRREDVKPPIKKVVNA